MMFIVIDGEGQFIEDATGKQIFDRQDEADTAATQHVRNYVDDSATVYELIKCQTFTVEVKKS